MADENEKVGRLLKRFEKAKSNSDLWQSMWDQAYSLIFPDRNLFHQETPGAQKNLQSYDNTAQIAATAFVASTHNGLTPLFSHWATLSSGSDVKEEEKPTLNRKLQKITDIVFDYIDNSNFNLVANESYHDLVFGTAAFLVNEGVTDIEPLMFRYVPLQDISIEETQMSELNNIWRLFKKVPINDIIQLWPNAKISPELEVRLERSPNAKIDIVEGTVFDVKKKIFTYYVIDKSNKKILWESESKSSPWVVFRWDKARGEVFGRGPGIIALPAISSLNQMAFDFLSGGALRANPIYMGFDDSVFNPWTVKIRPKTIVPISPLAGSTSPPIIPFPQSGDVQFGDFLMQDLRAQINKIFFTDPVGPVESPQMTATEINLRNQQNLEVKAPSIGRLVTELSSKTFKRVLFILTKKGLLPEIEIDNKSVQIVFKSELAKLKGLQDVNAITQTSQTLQTIMGPQLAIGGFNVEMLPEKIGEGLGVDLEVIKMPAEIAAQIEEQAKQAQQQTPQLPGAPVGGLPGQQGQSGPAQQ